MYPLAHNSDIIPSVLKQDGRSQSYAERKMVLVVRGPILVACTLAGVECLLWLSSGESAALQCRHEGGELLELRLKQGTTGTPRALYSLALEATHLHVSRLTTVAIYHFTASSLTPNTMYLFLAGSNSSTSWSAPLAMPAFGSSRKLGSWRLPSQAATHSVPSAGQVITLSSCPHVRISCILLHSFAMNLALCL